jgi:hypothetical protein
MAMQRKRTIMSDLSRRITVVVGASRGLGRGIARAFAEAGAPVVAVARTGPALTELATTSATIRTEVADAAEETVAWSLLDQYEPEVLILVAGAHPVMGPLQDQTWETFSVNWHTDVKITLPFGAWQLARGRGRRLAVGPNLFGLADLIDAATLGVLLGLGLFAVEPATEILAFLPSTLLPTVAVPVALTLYIVSLRELRAGARGKVRRTSMTIPTGEPTSGARKAITAAWPAGLPATVGTRLR